MLNFLSRALKLLNDINIVNIKNSLPKRTINENTRTYHTSVDYANRMLKKKSRIAIDV